MDAIRRDEQKRLNKNSRLRFKHCSYLLKKNREKLTPEEKIKVNEILSASQPIAKAYYLKEIFREVFKSQTREKALENLNNWCLESGNSELERFCKCAKTYSEWSKSILNSIEFNYTNGIIEGMNNKIKVLKRISYGVQNFKRFRNRIFHLD